MKIQQFLEHHGIVRNPFAEEDAQTDPVFKDYLATFELLKKYNQAQPNLTDTEYDASVADLAAGKAGFWFMGNWAEPDRKSTRLNSSH